MAGFLINIIILSLKVHLKYTANPHSFRQIPLFASLCVLENEIVNA